MSEVREKRSTRESEARPALSHPNNTRFNLRPDIIEKYNDYVFSFVCVPHHSSNPGNDNYDEAVEKGYEPVRYTDIPDLKKSHTVNPFGKEKDTANDFIINKQQILMRIKRDKWESHQESHRKNSHAEMVKRRKSLNAQFDEIHPLKQYNY